jgi:hypothetical protein
MQGERSKTAGEVRFVTDQSGDHERQIDDDDEFQYESDQLQDLSDILWRLSCSLGHLVSAHRDFTKIKAVRVSPDGKLGGRGYVQPIPEMRTNLSECIETMSAVIDTIDDEIRAPHWQEDQPGITDDDRQEVDETLEDAERIRDNPEDFSDEEYQEEVVDDEASP